MRLHVRGGVWARGQNLGTRQLNKVKQTNSAICEMLKVGFVLLAGILAIVQGQSEFLN